MANIVVAICFNETQASFINELSFAYDISFSEIIHCVHFILSNSMRVEWVSVEAGAVAQNVEFKFKLCSIDSGYLLRFDISDQFYALIISEGRKYNASTADACFIFYISCMQQVINLWKTNFDLYDRNSPVMVSEYRGVYDKFRREFEEVIV